MMTVCNNLKHPEWGMSETAQHRYLKAEYDDGKHPEWGMSETAQHRYLKAEYDDGM